jgi:MurNAc alpha-1-phosphate uridylyltransferase
MSTPTAGPTAMVLAAGLGTRMRPLTDSRPKPLIEVAGKALIDHVLDRLALSGVRRAVVNVHYLADQVERHLADRRAPAIVISDERAGLLDSGGGVVKALPHLGRDPFIIHNSDSIWIDGPASNLDRLLAAFDPEAMDALLLLAPIITSLGYEGAGDFAMDQAGRLRRRREREVLPLAFAGVSIAHPRLLGGLRPEPFSLNRAWDRALTAGRAYGLRLEGFWMHVGTPAAVAEADQWLAAGRAR